MESPLLPAMNVLYLCAGPAMNMREERETKLALNVKPDTSASKVRFSLHSCACPCSHLDFVHHSEYT